MQIEKKLSPSPLLFWLKFFNNRAEIPFFLTGLSDMELCCPIAKLHLVVKLVLLQHWKLLGFSNITLQPIYRHVYVKISHTHSAQGSISTTIYKILCSQQIGGNQVL